MEFKGGRDFPHTIKGGVEVLGRCHTKEGVITRGGDPSESIKRICRRKVAHGAIGGLNVLRDCCEEMGWKMAGGSYGGGQAVRGLVFPFKLGRKDGDQDL